MLYKVDNSDICYKQVQAEVYFLNNPLEGVTPYP